MRPHFGARAPVPRNTGRRDPVAPTVPDAHPDPGDGIYGHISRGDLGPVKPRIAVPPKSSPSKKPPSSRPVPDLVPETPVPGSQEAIDTFFAKKEEAREAFYAGHSGRIKRPEDIFDMDTMTTPFANLFFDGKEAYTSDGAPVLPLLDLVAIRDFVADPSGPEWDWMKYTVEDRNRVRGETNAVLKELWTVLREHHGEKVNLSNVHTSIVNMEARGFVNGSSPRGYHDDPKVDAAAKNSILTQGFFDILKSTVDIDASPTDSDPMSDMELKNAEDVMTRAEGEAIGGEGFEGSFGSLKDNMSDHANFNTIREDMFKGFGITGSKDIPKAIGVVVALINGYPDHAKKMGWVISDRNIEKHMIFAEGMLRGAVNAYDMYSRIPKGEPFEIHTGAPKRRPRDPPTSPTFWTDVWTVAFLFALISIITVLAQMATGSIRDIDVPDNLINGSGTRVPQHKETVAALDRPGLFSSSPLEDVISDEQADEETIQAISIAGDRAQAAANEITRLERGLRGLLDVQEIPIHMGDEDDDDPIKLKHMLGGRRTSKMKRGTIGQMAFDLNEERGRLAEIKTRGLLDADSIQRRRSFANQSDWSVQEQLANGITSIDISNPLDVAFDYREIAYRTADAFRSYDAGRWKIMGKGSWEWSSNAFGKYAFWADDANATGVTASTEIDPRDRMDAKLKRSGAGTIHLILDRVNDYALFTAASATLRMTLISAGTGAFVAGRIMGFDATAERIIPSFLPIPGGKKAEAVWMLSESLFRGFERVHKELIIRDIADNLFPMTMFSTLVNWIDTSTWGVFGLSTHTVGMYDIVRTILLLQGLYKTRSIMRMLGDLAIIVSPISPASVIVMVTLLDKTTGGAAIYMDRVTNTVNNILGSAVFGARASFFRLISRIPVTRNTRIRDLVEIFAKSKSILDDLVKGDHNTTDDDIDIHAATPSQMARAGASQLISEVFLGGDRWTEWGFLRFLDRLLAISRPVSYGIVVREAAIALHKTGGIAIAAQFFHGIGELVMTYWKLAMILSATVSIQGFVGHYDPIAPTDLFNVTREGIPGKVAYKDMYGPEKYAVSTYRQWIQAPYSKDTEVQRIEIASECAYGQDERTARDCASMLTTKERDMLASWSAKSMEMSGMLLSMGSWSSNVTDAAARLSGISPYRDPYTARGTWFTDGGYRIPFPISSVPEEMSFIQGIWKRMYYESSEISVTQHTPGILTSYAVRSEDIRRVTAYYPWFNVRGMAFEPDTTLFPEAMSEDTAYILWSVIRAHFPGEEERAFSTDHYVRQVIEKTIAHKTPEILPSSPLSRE